MVKSLAQTRLATESPGQSRLAERLRWWLQKHERPLRRAAVILLLLAFALAGWTLPIRDVANWIQQAAQRLGPWGTGVYFIAFLAMSLLSIPVWAMPFAAGALFGVVWGTVITSVSCTISAAACFGIARLMRETSLRKWLESSARMRALERVVAASNWRIVAAVRLSHFMTFGMQNYGFGLTKIDFRTFLITTWAVTLPGILLQVYLGDLGFDSLDAWQSESFDALAWVLRIGGLAVMATAVGYLGYRLRSAFQKAASEPLHQAEESEASSEANRRHWPWGVLGLAGFAMLMMGMAIWCAVQREALRQLFQPADDDVPGISIRHERRSFA